MLLQCGGLSVAVVAYEVLLLVVRPASIELIQATTW